MIVFPGMKSQNLALRHPFYLLFLLLFLFLIRRINCIDMYIVHFADGGDGQQEMVKNGVYYEI